MTNFLGTAYGRVCVRGGKLCLWDMHSNLLFKLVSNERAIAERLLAADGLFVKLTFEMCELSHDGYVIPRQLERRPEEYHPPRMETLIFTTEDECGLSPGNHQDIPPCIYGHLMATHKAGEAMEPSAFQLSPIDYTLLMGQLEDPSEEWMKYKVIRAKIEVFPGHKNRYYIKDLLSIQDHEEWLNESVSVSETLSLAPAETEEEANSKPIETRPRRRSISTRLRYEILLRDGHRCVDCGASAKEDPFVRLEIDHRLPVSKGGTNDPENLQTLCWACNNGKSDRIDHKLITEPEGFDPWSEIPEAC